MKITDRQVLEFYANPEIMEKNNFPITEQYLNKLREENRFSLDIPANQKNYIGLALTFMGQNDKSQKDDRCFLKDLQTRDKEGILFGENGMTSLSFLEGSFTQDCNFAKRRSFVFLENISDIYSVELPKWHLFVSWAAGRESGDFPQKGLNLDGTWRFDCAELLLWMCEAAKSDKTKCFYDELLEIEAGDHKDVRNRIMSDWAPKVRAEIKRIISKE